AAVISGGLAEIWVSRVHPALDASGEIARRDAARPQLGGRVLANLVAVRASDDDRLSGRQLGAPVRDLFGGSDWRAELPAGKPVVVTCAHGHEVGQNAAAELRASGIAARYLAGGVEGWVDAGYPYLRKTATYDGSQSLSWITRA